MGRQGGFEVITPSPVLTYGTYYIGMLIATYLQCTSSIAFYAIAADIQAVSGYTRFSNECTTITIYKSRIP